MRKKWKFLIGSSIVGLTAITMPILITSCARTTITSEYSSIWKLDNDKTTLYLKGYNFGNNLEDIRIYDNSNQQEILFNINNSKITNEEIYINFTDDVSKISSFRITNKATGLDVVIGNSQTKSFKEYNLQEDSKYFFNLIKDMSNNSIPTFGILRNATLALQQAFYIALVDYFNNPNSDLDKSFIFGKNIILDQNRFNKDALINNKVWSGNNNIDIQNYEKLNLFFNDEMFYNDDVISNQMISIFNKVLNKLKEANKIQSNYFDFFHEDINFMSKLRNFDANYFNYLFKNANRIIILSDGANHSANTLPQLAELYSNHKPRPRSEVIKILNDFKENKISTLTQRDVLDFMLIKNYEAINENSQFNFVSFVNYDGNVFNAMNINDDNRFNDSAFSTNFTDYTQCITDSDKQKEYLNVYSKLFANNNLTKDDVFVNGVNEYDPNKKNAIFIGSSLFKPLSGDVTANNYSRLDKMPSVLAEINSMFDSFLKKFPTNEYNIIFKLHPVFSNASDPQNLGAINYVKQITNNKITNPIIVGSNVALETWISLDYYNYKQNPDNTDSSIIFRKAKDSSDVNSAKEWTTFFGLQATSTTIHTTRLFYQSAFNLNINEVADLIPFSNFPIPKLFPVVDRLTENNSKKDYTNDNIRRINSIYSPFCPSITYSLVNSLDGLEKYDSIKLNF